MNFVTVLIAKFTDTLNPIVVKELRQAVQGKLFSVILMVFLGLLLLTMGLFLSSETMESSFNAGRNLFGILLSILLSTCLLFVPAYTGIRVGAERSDANVDLLFITTLPPRSIIWGKFLAALVLTVLLHSACLPFMTFTYLLRGVDLLSIFVLMALTFIVAGVAIQCAIFLGCIPANRFFRIILGVGWLVAAAGSIPALSLMMYGPGGLLDSGIGGMIGTWQFWRVALSVLAGGIVLISLLGLLSIALISPLSSNRALPVRLFVTGVWFLTGIGTAIWSFASSNLTPLGAWAAVHVLLHSIGLLIAVSEREHLGPRVRHSIPLKRWRRPLAFLFYSGAAGGVLWSSLMIVLTLITIVVLVERYPLMWTGQFYNDFLTINIVIPLHALVYALGASIIRRRFFGNRIAGGYTCVIAIILLDITTMIVPLILFFMTGTWEKEWLIGSPIGPILAVPDGEYHLAYSSLGIAVVGALLVFALSIPWFFRQIRNFHPPNKYTTPQFQTNEPS